jgi:chaperonin GroEL (HSP60 family)
VSRTVEDCFSSGVLDSLKVTRLAVLHAASIAGMVASTNVVVHKETKYNPPSLEFFGKETF